MNNIKIDIIEVEWYIEEIEEKLVKIKKKLETIKEIEKYDKSNRNNSEFRSILLSSRCNDTTRFSKSNIQNN